MPIRGHRIRPLLGAAIGLLALLAPPAARGDEPLRDPDLSTEGMRPLGPLRVRPFILVKDVGYDDNITFDSSQPLGDWTATAALGARAVLPMGDRGGILLQHESDYVAFLKYTDLNHLDGVTRAKAIGFLRDVEVWLEGSYASIEGRPTTEFLERIRQRVHALTTGARSLGEGRLGWSGYLRRERFSHGPGSGEAEATYQNLDRAEGTLSLTGVLKILPKTSLTLEGRRERISDEGSAQDRDARVTTILPGIEMDPSAPLQAAIRIGVARLEASEWGGATSSGCAVGEGNLTARLGGSGRVRAVVSRALEASASDTYLYYLANAWSAGYEQFFSQRWSAEILHGRGLNDYPEASASAPGPARRDRFETWEGAVRCRLEGGLMLTAVARRDQRDGTSGHMERGFYTVGASLDFQVAP